MTELTRDDRSEAANGNGVFLCHNDADGPEVIALATKLREMGLDPWLDDWHLVPGEPRLPAIARAITRSTACAVLVGPSGIGPLDESEMWVAMHHDLTSKRDARRYSVIPVLLPGATRGDRSRLPGFLKSNSWIEFHRSIDEPTALERIAQAIRGKSSEAAPPPSDLQCPYRGLSYFDVDHSSLFFGREAMTDWILSRLRGTATKEGPTRFLAIIGASGSGKSSLARAGLLARLRVGDLPGSASWPMVICRPENRPLESLATAMAAIEGASLGPLARSELIPGLVRSLSESPHYLHLWSLAAMPANDPNWRLVVFVDQFEEVFTLGSHEPKGGQIASTSELTADRLAFVHNLLRAATLDQGRTIVILTMRADFYSRCTSIPELATAVSHHQEFIGPMSADELRRAIELPAQLAGSEIEEGLVEQLVAELTSNAGALPLLQYALAELWQKSREQGLKSLTAATYRDLGGWTGALSRRADSVFAEFRGTPRETHCRNLFLSLVQPGEGTEDTKRLVRWSELRRGTERESAELQETVRALADSRLITTGSDTLTDDSTIEVIHEALIRSWPELRNWLDADRTGLRIHLRLTEAAREWANSHESERHRDPTLLASGVRLAIGQEWAQRNPAALSALDRQYLQASQDALRKARLRRWRIASTAAAAIVLAATIGSRIWSNHEALNQAQFLADEIENAKLGTVQQLLQDNPERVRQLAIPLLLERYGKLELDDPAKLNAAIAIMPYDPEPLDFLAGKLLRVPRTDFPSVRDVLKPHSGEIVPSLWSQALELATLPPGDSSVPQSFQAACALATYAPQDEQWPQIADHVVKRLIHLPLSQFLDWRAALKPASQSLSQPLLDACRSSHPDSIARQFAAETLVEFTEGSYEFIAEAMLSADPRTFETLLAAIQPHHVPAISRFRAEVDPNRQPENPITVSADKEAAAARKSRAHLALLRLGEEHLFWQQLEFRPRPDDPASQDPRLKIELIHHLADFHVDHELLKSRLKDARFRDAPSIRRSLFLTLAILADRIPEQQREALCDGLDLLAQFENDPDPGIHSALDLLLRRTGKSRERNQVLARLADQHTGPPVTPASAGRQRWFVNSLGQTFVCLPAGEFQMGSPDDEPMRALNENQHRRQISRPFAMSATEVTREQYLQFCRETGAPDKPNRYVATLDSPQTMVTWYEAAWFCNWLSERENLEPCYEPNDDHKFAQGMRIKADFMDRSGYRLPTEVEWEYACRAGSITVRHHGDSEARLPEYAWYSQNNQDRTAPVGQRLPNDAGLFDILGNAYEWCHDRLLPYPEGAAEPAATPGDNPETVEEAHRRAVRGGAFFDPPPFVRSASRYYGTPSADDYFVAFRIVRTCR